MGRWIGFLVVMLLAGAGVFLWRDSGAAVEARAPVFSWGTAGREEPGTFEKPRCVAVAPDGSVYVLDLTGRIQRFTQDGEYRGQIEMPDVSVGRPQGIDVDGEGNLYVADTHYNRVLKFSPEGEILLEFGSGVERKEPGPAGTLFWPCAIVVAPDGRIVTAEYGGGDRVQVWSAAGEWLAAFGRFGEGEGEFMRPAGLALNAAGQLYVADASNHRVQIFSLAGACLGAWSAPGMSYPYDLAIDRDDRVYTIEYGAHRVCRFAADGTPEGAWGALGAGGDALSHPWGLDVTPEGRVLITDTMNHRVVRLEPDGFRLPEEG